MSATPNPMTDTLRAHTSVRAFTDEPVSQEDLEAIYESARAASSTCFLQVTTAIRITDKELKAKLAELAGNQKTSLRPLSSGCSARIITAIRSSCRRRISAGPSS